MTQYHMGINLGHERSVAIVKEGEIQVAIEQERLDRKKYSLGYLLQAPGVASQIQPPFEAIRYCLDTCGIAMSDLASITANMPGNDYAPEILRRVLPAEIAEKVLKIPSHHLAHAYSAYWNSDFEDALILVTDASGSTLDQRTESYTIYEGHGQTITTLHSETVTAHLAGLSTLGFIYEYVTRKAGFVTEVGGKVRHAEAGKLMGLAPYGQPQPNWHRWIRTIENSYSLDISAYDIFLEIAALEKQYDMGEGKPYLRPYLVDLAYKVQSELEQALLHIVGLAMQQTGLRKLCLAGGVSLNSVANYELLRQLNLEDIFVFPAASDSGIAAGCALWAYHTIEGGQKRVPLKKASLGRHYSQDVISQALHHFQGSIEVEELSPEEMIVRSAKALSKGNVVARFEGGSEYGPRALGQRSIMADPTFKHMKDILNARVKFREAFRPFAPVIPLEAISEVFEQSVAAPFMLLVSSIKPEFHEQIPAVTHVDGTGRVQTVTASENPYFYQVCYQLVRERQGVPVLLNTSFNVAGQPIVETPLEAIETFLSTDIDYLAIENYWISKRHFPVLSYEEHLAKVGASSLPAGLGEGAAEVTDLMKKLDRALFFGETQDCPWSLAELKELSAQGARYKETSRLFPETPLGQSLQTKLSDEVVLLLDPLGESTLVDLTQQVPSTNYSYEDIQLLLSVLYAPVEAIEQLRIQRRLTTFEFEQQIQWAQQRLSLYRLQPHHYYNFPRLLDSHLENSQGRTFAAFANENFSARQQLRRLYECLQQAGYTASNICEILGISALQTLKPTHLHYYDRYRLPESILGDLIRLFLLRGALSEARSRQLFGDELLNTLTHLGLLIPRGENWASRVDLFEVAGLYFATDHRYMMLPEDQLDEDPVMYIGSDSLGLVCTAPQYSVDRVLDLCCGSGIQGLVASRYANEVISVDINPRAIRFARFNAQLNGVNNIQVRLGDLYQAIDGQFNTILANPPFVPSPTQELGFRDGGTSGEEILARIISGSANHLMPEGQLFIVTDLVDVQNYELKLNQWWKGGTAHKLVLSTADRDDLLFSVPHCHAAFNQTVEQYNTKLEQWVNNFHAEHLTAVNFGYILIRQSEAIQSSSYYLRTIHNPTHPIHHEVESYFQHCDLLDRADVMNYYLAIAPDLNFRLEMHPSKRDRTIELFSKDNPYFTTYSISEQMYRLLQDIHQLQPQWSAYANSGSQDCLKDLIYKGILCLTPNPPQVKRNRRLNDPAPAQGLSIVELQTKTTPTCLSAYISQG